MSSIKLNKRDINNSELNSEHSTSTSTSRPITSKLLNLEIANSSRDIATAHSHNQTTNMEKDTAYLQPVPNGLGNEMPVSQETFHEGEKKSSEEESELFEEESEPFEEESEPFEEEEPNLFVPNPNFKSSFDKEEETFDKEEEEEEEEKNCFLFISEKFGAVVPNSSKKTPKSSKKRSPQKSSEEISLESKSKKILNPQFWGKMFKKTGIQNCKQFISILVLILTKNTQINLDASKCNLSNCLNELFKESQEDFFEMFISNFISIFEKSPMIKGMLKKKLTSELDESIRLEFIEQNILKKIYREPLDKQIKFFEKFVELEEYGDTFIYYGKELHTLSMYPDPQNSAEIVCNQIAETVSFKFNSDTYSNQDFHQYFENVLFPLMEILLKMRFGKNRDINITSIQFSENMDKIVHSVNELLFYFGKVPFDDFRSSQFDAGNKFKELYKKYNESKPIDIVQLVLDLFTFLTNEFPHLTYDTLIVAPIPKITIKNLEENQEKLFELMSNSFSDTFFSILKKMIPIVFSLMGYFEGRLDQLILSQWKKWNHRNLRNIPDFLVDFLNKNGLMIKKQAKDQKSSKKDPENWKKKTGRKWRNTRNS